MDGRVLPVALSIIPSMKSQARFAAGFLLLFDTILQVLDSTSLAAQ
jgi:hypothetical protein